MNWFYHEIDVHWFTTFAKSSLMTLAGAPKSRSTGYT